MEFLFLVPSAISSTDLSNTQNVKSPGPERLVHCNHNQPIVMLQCFYVWSQSYCAAFSAQCNSHTLSCKPCDKRQLFNKTPLPVVPEPNNILLHITYCVIVEQLVNR